MRISGLTALVITCIALLVSINAIPEQPRVPTAPPEHRPLLDFSPLMDLAQLNLEVVSTEVVDQLVDNHPLAENAEYTLETKEGFKLFIVTLKGTVPNSWPIILGAWEFTAICMKEGKIETKRRDETTIQKTVSYDIVNSSAVELLTGRWSSGETIMHAVEEPGPIIIRVAFSLPEATTRFFVRYPTFARGDAVVSASTEELN